MITNNGILNSSVRLLRHSSTAKTFFIKAIGLIVSTGFSFLAIREVVGIGGVRLFALNSLITSIGVLVAMLELGLAAAVTNSAVEFTHTNNPQSLHSSLVFAIRHLVIRMALVIAIVVILYFSGTLSTIVQNLGYSPLEVKWLAVGTVIMALNLPFIIFSSVLLGINSWHSVIFIQIISSPLTLVFVSTVSYLKLPPGLVLASGPFSSLFV